MIQQWKKLDFQKNIWPLLTIILYGKENVEKLFLYQWNDPTVRQVFRKLNRISHNCDQYYSNRGKLSLRIIILKLEMQGIACLDFHAVVKNWSNFAYLSDCVRYGHYFPLWKPIFGEQGNLWDQLLGIRDISNDIVVEAISSLAYIKVYIMTSRQQTGDLPAAFNGLCRWQ